MAGMELAGYADVIEDFEDLKEQYATETVYVVGTNVEYAAYVEFGTSQMEAQPYLFPAARKVASNPGRYFEDPESTEEFVQLLALAIEREAKERAPVDTGRLRASIEASKVE